jgi:hypothetical protein
MVKQEQLHAAVPTAAPCKASAAYNCRSSTYWATTTTVAAATAAIIAAAAAPMAKVHTKQPRTWL